MRERFHLFTLGCKINQYETHALREAWLAKGFLESEDPAEADVVLVNTCAVTEGALRDVRKALLRLRRSAPHARIIVTGCAARTFQDEIAEAEPEARIVPQEHKELLLHGPDAEENGTVEGGFSGLSISGFKRIRAVLKVQDGCSHRCSYCFVPTARGPAVSRDPKEVLAEARRLFEAGHPEIVLSGINLRQYRPRADYDFWDLVGFLHKELAAEWAGRAGMRFSSIDPGQLGPKALDLLAECMGAGKLVKPHLHLALQSASPAVLQRMGRSHYSSDDIAQFLEALSSDIPLFGLGCDVLVGFPGENLREFEETTRFCHYLPLSYAHVFPYSPRPGTKAASMPMQLPLEEKKRRAKHIREIAAMKGHEFLQKLCTKESVQLVYEGSDKVGGRCEYYAECRFDTAPPNAKAGDILQARPIGISKQSLRVCIDARKGARVAPSI
jgi:MiaB/RimO family radical SAM methylthiotransferase